MGLANYTELKDQLGDWLIREDLTAVIPTFITLAEEALNKELRVRPMLVRAITVPAADEPRENLPGDYLELKAIQFNCDPLYVPEYRTPAWLRAYRRSSANTGGVPRFYSIEGGELLFDVTPSEVELEILYYQRIPSLNDTTQPTNAILTEYPSLYLYGALLHTAPYLKDDPRVATWSTLYQQALYNAKKDDRGAEVNSSPINVVPRRSIR